MEHFYKNIEGFSELGEQGLLLSAVLKYLPENPKILELGVYQGRLTAIWNVELINRGIDYKYYCIDHFLGSEEHNKNIDYFSLTKNNLSQISDKISIIKADSLDAAKQFLDNTFDLIYIDASHDYESVKKDINTWLPKVKTGGVLCGDDYVSGWFGVIKAVDEIFDNNKTIVGHQQWFTIK